jgi:hypothetical protein
MRIPWHGMPLCSLALLYDVVKEEKVEKEEVEDEEVKEGFP